MRGLERFAPHALGVAIFIAVAGIALVPTVDATRSSAHAVPKKPAATTAERIASQLSELVTTTTADPKLDTTPTVPPPDDLSSVVVDVSDLGFLRLSDPAFDAPFDVSSLPGKASTDRVKRLTNEGFSRGYLRGQRTVDQVGLEIDVYEFATVAGASAELAYLRGVIEGDPTADRVTVADLPQAVGFRFDDVETSGTYHELVLAVANGARFYRVLLSSSAAQPDLELGSTVLARQAAAA
jgi:hypothetical protein